MQQINSSPQATTAGLSFPRLSRTALRAGAAFLAFSGSSFLTYAFPEASGPTAPGKTAQSATLLQGPAEECSAEGYILWELWPNAPGHNVADIPVSTVPAATFRLTSFASPRNVADNYGSRIRGYLCPPQSGNYTFWLSGDNNSELWLSPDDNSANKQKIAYLNGFAETGEWDKFPTQKSRTFRLEAGRRYYIEALQKEDIGEDHLAVAWQLPNGALEAPLAGTHLSPIRPETNFAPTVEFTAPLSGHSFTQGLPIQVAVAAADLYGQVEKVEFFAGAALIATATAEPFGFSWLGAPAGRHSLRAMAYDREGATGSAEITVEVQPVTASCTGTGTILREYWSDVPGVGIQFVPVHLPPSGTSQLTQFEGPTDFGDNYGSRIRGYVCPPFSGNYIFYLASDNNSALYLSPNEDPAKKELIAHLQGFTLPREWNKYPTQVSRTLNLVGGRRYYIEALQKEELAGDHLAVGWKMPDGTLEAPIAGSRLSPYVEPLLSLVPSLGRGPLLRAFPTRFTEGVRIVFQTDFPGPATLDLYDLRGELVSRLYEGSTSSPEETTVELRGQNLAQGMYLLRLQTGKGATTQKIILHR